MCFLVLCCPPSIVACRRAWRLSIWSWKCSKIRHWAHSGRGDVTGSVFQSGSAYTLFFSLWSICAVRPFYIATYSNYLMKPRMLAFCSVWCFLIFVFLFHSNNGESLYFGKIYCVTFFIHTVLITSHFSATSFLSRLNFCMSIFQFLQQYDAV